MDKTIQKTKQTVLTGKPVHPTVFHLPVIRIVAPEPFRREQRRVGLGLGDVLGVAPPCGRLDREVPVGYGQLGVDDLKAVLEGVGQQRVARHEAQTVVELFLLEKGKTSKGMAAVG